MDHVRSKQLREKRAKLIFDAQALAPAGNAAMTAEVRTRINRMLTDADALKEDITTAERLEAADAESRSTVTPPRGAPGMAGASLNAVDAEKHKDPHSDLPFQLFQRTIPLGARHVNRLDLQPVTLSVFHQRGWRVEPHRLVVEQRRRKRS